MNWLGQDIVPGSVVYRGARAGNSSDFKVGVVESVNDGKGTARVAWKYEPGWYLYRQDSQGNQERLTAPVREMDSKGSPSINSLVVIDVDITILQAQVKLARDWKNTDLPTSEYNALLEELAAG